MRQCVHILTLLLLLAAPLQAQSKREEVRKANTYFNNEEWVMANKFYSSLIEEYPKEYSYYPYAIVSIAQADSTAALIPYIKQSQISGAELEPLLAEIRNLARKVGNSSVYVRTLNELKREQPWFTNLADRLLVSHYLFQKEYAEAKLLIGSLIERFPTSIEIKKAQAELLQQSGNIYGAIEEYRTILEQKENDLDALLYLGGHYLLTAEREIATIQEQYKEIANPSHMQHSIYRSHLKKVQDSDVAQAIEYLERVYTLHPTTYTFELLERTEKLNQLERHMQPL